MTGIRGAVRRLRDRRAQGDDGFSLIESLIAMVIFTIFMGIATGAIISIMRSTQKTQNLTNSATEVENAFQTLDHQVRYSDVITLPNAAPVNNAYYVEFHQQATSTSVETCYQLKYDLTSKTLLERNWKPKASPVSATPWKLLAHTLAPGNPPFVQTGAGNKNAAGEVLNAHQQLAVSVTVQASFGKTSEGSALAANFTALNSTTTSGIACQEVGRT